MDETRKQAIADFIRLITGTGDATGGYLVPEEFRTEVIRKVEKMAQIRSRARVFPMTTDIANFPTATNGFVAYWGQAVGGTGITESDPSFGQKVFTAQNLTIAGRVDKDLLSDANVDVVDIITDMVAEKIYLAEDTAFVNGSGSGSSQPLGILQDTDVSAVLTAGIGTLASDDILTLIYTLESQYRAGATFLMNNAVILAVRKLKDSDNRYLWQENYKAGEPATLGGYPVLEINDMASAVSAGNKIMVFGQLNKYYVGDRKTMTIETSDQAEDAFLKDQVIVKCKERVDGRVADPNAFKIMTVRTS